MSGNAYEAIKLNVNIDSSRQELGKGSTATYDDKILMAGTNLVVEEDPKEATLLRPVEANPDIDEHGRSACIIATPRFNTCIALSCNMLASAIPTLLLNPDQPERP